MAELERYLERTESAAAGAAAGEYEFGSASDVVPPERPPWVDVPAFSIGTVDYVPVDSGPYATRGECRRALAEAMQQAVTEYVRDHRGDEGAVEHLVFDASYVKAHLRQGGVYEETVQASFGPMRQQHALLKFGKEFRDEIDRRWNQVVVTSRLAQVGLLAASVIVGLGIVFDCVCLPAGRHGHPRLLHEAVAVCRRGGHTEHRGPRGSPGPLGSLVVAILGRPGPCFACDSFHWGPSVSAALCGCIECFKRP
jgi:hypothetical protein